MRADPEREPEVAPRVGLRLLLLNTRQAPAVDETRIIAAILCARTTSADDDADDAVCKIVDLYERILAELRARGHGGPTT